MICTKFWLYPPNSCWPSLWVRSPMVRVTFSGFWISWLLPTNCTSLSQFPPIVHLHISSHQLSSSSQFPGKKCQADFISFLFSLLLPVSNQTNSLLSPRSPSSNVCQCVTCTQTDFFPRLLWAYKEDILQYIYWLNKMSDIKRNI